MGEADDMTVAVLGAKLTTAPPMRLKDKIEDLFTYHSPTGDQPKQYQAIRDKAKELAHVIVDNTPPSADQTAAIRLLREAVMTASIALNGIG